MQGRSGSGGSGRRGVVCGRSKWLEGRGRVLWQGRQQKAGRWGKGPGGRPSISSGPLVFQSALAPALHRLVGQGLSVVPSYLLASHQHLEQLMSQNPPETGQHGEQDVEHRVQSPASPNHP